MTYDPKCLELAQAFLGDYREELDAFGVWSAYADELAQRIQMAIEDFLEEKELVK